MINTAEVDRRNRYWFEHWQEFSHRVVVSTPVTRTAHVGAFMGDLFGSLPVPYQSRNIDTGTFEIHDGCFWVYSATQTYCWTIGGPEVRFFSDGVEIRTPNSPVFVLRGPVAAPLAGAYAAHGFLGAS